MMIADETSKEKTAFPVDHISLWADLSNLSDICLSVSNLSLSLDICANYFHFDTHISLCATTYF